MNKIIPLFSSSQVVSLRKNKKGRIKRTHTNPNLYLQHFLPSKPKEISHREGKDLREKLKALPERQLEVVNALLKATVNSGDAGVDTKARPYFRKIGRFRDDKSVSRAVCTSESLGLIEVEQYIKKVNHYKLGPLLKDPIVTSYLVSIFPCLRRILPGLFSLSLLLSQKTHSERNVPQLRMNIYNKKENFYKKNNEEKKMDEFSRDFVLGDTHERKKIPEKVSDNRANLSPGNDTKDISCCTFRKMKNGERKSYMQRHCISFKDSDKGLVPISERRQDMLLCKKTCK